MSSFLILFSKQVYHKHCVQKAKADNKYFAAMRDRESVDLERKNAIRNLEKQGKVIERLADSEKTLQQQIVRYFVIWFSLVSPSSSCLRVISKQSTSACIEWWMI